MYIWMYVCVCGVGIVEILERKKRVSFFIDFESFDIVQACNWEALQGIIFMGA